MSRQFGYVILEFWKGVDCRCKFGESLVYGWNQRSENKGIRMSPRGTPLQIKEITIPKRPLRLQSMEIRCL
jgi:hypothetical protein